MSYSILIIDKHSETLAYTKSLFANEKEEFSIIEVESDKNLDKILQSQNISVILFHVKSIKQNIKDFISNIKNNHFSKHFKLSNSSEYLSLK